MTSGQTGALLPGVLHATSAEASLHVAVDAGFDADGRLDSDRFLAGGAGRGLGLGRDILPRLSTAVTLLSAVRNLRRRVFKVNRALLVLLVLLVLRVLLLRWRGPRALPSSSVDLHLPGCTLILHCHHMHRERGCIEKRSGEESPNLQRACLKWSTIGHTC